MRKCSEDFQSNTHFEPSLDPLPAAYTATMITKPQSGNCRVQRASTNYMKLIPQSQQDSTKSTCVFHFEAQFKGHRMC